MDTENEYPNEEIEEAPEGSDRWFARFTDGKWYCECDGRARCFTIKNEDNPNKGRRFWVCNRKQGDSKRCHLWLWVDDEEVAKAWLAKHPVCQDTPKAPQTPPRPRNSSNPWTKSARKRPHPVQVSDEQEELFSVNQSTQSTNGSQNISNSSSPSPVNVAIDGSSRKSTRASRYSTPGRSCNASLLAPEASLQMPTPQTGESEAVLGSPWSRESTPSPSMRRSYPRERSSDVANTVLELLCSDRVVLRQTTKIKIQRAINQELQGNKANRENDERTILELYSKLDQSEIKVEDLERENAGLLIEVGAVSESVELSD